MKRLHIPLLFFILLIGSVSGVARVRAQEDPSPTVTQSPTDSPAGENDKSRQIEDLKTRLATKVAELRQTTKRAFFGTVKSKTVSTITIETKTKDIKIELTDEIKVAQVIRGTRTNLTAEDLERGDFVTVFGDYDATLDLLSASYIFVESGGELVRITGTIITKDEDTFELTLAGSDGTQYTVGYERTTKATGWTKDKGVAKSGFSSLTEGDFMYLVATRVPKKENELSAVRILSLGNLTGAKATPEVTQAAEASPSATPTGTGKPTIKPTAKPTVRATTKPSPTVTKVP